MKIGDEVYIHGYIDEIRKDTIIIRNDGGYFGTVQEEISVNPQEPCDDTISRKAVLEQAYNWWSGDEFLRVTNPFDYLRKRINSLPSVNPQPKTGHWTIKQYQVPIEYKQVPTVSNVTFPTESTTYKIIYTYTHSDCKSEEYFNKYNYCPNCGARMVEPQESEDKSDV